MRPGCECLGAPHWRGAPTAASAMPLWEAVAGRRAYTGRDGWQLPGIQRRACGSRAGPAATALRAEGHPTQGGPRRDVRLRTSCSWARAPHTCAATVISSSTWVTSGGGRSQRLVLPLAAEPAARARAQPLGTDDGKRREWEINSTPGSKGPSGRFYSLFACRRVCTAMCE